MTIDEYSELFAIKMRGLVAAAFGMTRTQPDKDMWKMLRGEKDLTIRAIGEAFHACGLNAVVEINDPTQPAAPTNEGDR